MRKTGRRDLTFDAMSTVAERLSAQYADSGLAVAARQRRSLWRWSVTDRLEVGDNWTNVVEVVRRRRFFYTAWNDVQSVPEAASKIGRFIGERPDLTSPSRHG